MGHGNQELLEDEAELLEIAEVLGGALSVTDVGAFLLLELEVGLQFGMLKLLPTLQVEGWGCH